MIINQMKTAYKQRIQKGKQNPYFLNVQSTRNIGDEWLDSSLFDNESNYIITKYKFVKAENNMGLTESITNYLPPNNPAVNLQEAVKSSEHQMILAAIQTTDSRMEAAAKLGISPRTLRYKLAKLKADNSTMALAA